MVGDGVSEELSRVKVGKDAASSLPLASKRGSGSGESALWRKRKPLPLPRRHLPEGALGVECEQPAFVGLRRGRGHRRFATISNAQVTANITHWGIAPSTRCLLPWWRCTGRRAARPPGSEKMRCAPWRRLTVCAASGRKISAQQTAGVERATKWVSLS